MTSNTGGSLVAGMMIGAAIARNQEQSKQRRQRQKGSDRLLVSTKYSPKEVVQRIVKKFPHTYRKGEHDTLMRKEPTFSISSAIMTFLAGGLIVALIAAVRTDYNETYPWMKVLVTSMLIAGFSGIIFGGDSEEEDIIIQSYKNGSSVELRLFDDDGLRTFNERDVLDILEVLS